MSWIAAAVVGGAVVSGVASSRAAGKASDAQQETAELGIDEQRAQFERTQELLAPYVGAGNQSLNAQQSMLGLNGDAQQLEQIQMMEQSPLYQNLKQQGNDAILQNASATGGLRGGNTQSALAQYSPQLLNQLLEQRYSKLDGLARVGQASAAGVGAAGQQLGANVSNLYQQQGAAQAGAHLAQANAIGGVGNAVQTLGIMKHNKVF